MRYYTGIFIDRKCMIIRVIDKPTPCTRAQALYWAENEEKKTSTVMLALVDRNHIKEKGRQECMKFNLFSIKNNQLDKLF